MDRRTFLWVAALSAGSLAAACTHRGIPPLPGPSLSRLPQISAPAIAFTSTPGTAIFVGNVVILPSGRWLMVYQESPPRRPSVVMGRYSEDDGRTFAAPFLINLARSPLIDPFAVVTDSGKLVLHYQTRFQTNGGGGRIRQIVSMDEGATWTKAENASVVAGAGTPDDQANEAVLLKLDDGRLLLIYVAFSATPTGERLRSRIVAASSVDEGDHWSDATIIHDLGRENLQVRSVGVQLSSGRLHCYFNTWEDDPVTKIRKIKVAFSDDRGVSWRPGPGPGARSDVVASVKAVDLIVPWPVRRQDGTISVAFVAVVPNHGREIWIVESQDEGITWSSPLVANDVTHGVGRPVIVTASDADVMYEDGQVPTDRDQVVYQLIPK